MSFHFLIPRKLDPSALKRRLDQRSIVSLGGDTMGTSWSVKVAGVQGCRSEEIRREIEAVFATIISQMSLWEPNSEISKFNRLESGGSLHSSHAFATVLSKAVEVFEDTSGAYSPFLAEAVNLLGFGPNESVQEIPGETMELYLSRFQREIAAFIQQPFRDDARLIQPGHIRLDLNGIAKGFAADLVAQKLLELGADGGFVEIGGDGVGFGCKPDGLPWTVGVEKPPGSDDDTPTYQVALPGVAFASSGNTRRFHTRADGRRSGHVVNPRRLDLIDDHLLSVTVFHRECMSADALATALFVMGRERGMQWAEIAGVSAIFYGHSNEGKGVEATLSDAMGKLFEL